MLRNFAATTAAENAAARPIVEKLIAASPEQRTALLERNPQWRTAGVVRKLLARVDETNYTDPKLAADLAALAVEVAEQINPKLYPADTVMKLRAVAWRERGYALMYVGSFPEALAALDRSDECLNECAVSDYDHARAGMYRALIYREFERFSEALSIVREARPVFEAYGDRKHAALADGTEAAVLMALGRLSEALAIHLRIAADNALDHESRACALSNAGQCYLDLSQFAEAKRMFAHAVSSFEELGLVSRRAISRWWLARALSDEGSYEQALPLLVAIRSEFEELGMSEDVALVALHAADVLLILERPAEVAELCRSSIEYFAKAGLAYSQSAMTALAYLREAADQGTLSPAKVKQVRAFFKVLPKQPHLLFAYHS
jgi:tetratricopeptide (TPR) repeat protein